MKATFFVSAAVLASGALAASSSYIPSGISSTCTSFLTTLNTDASLASCTSSLLTATKAYSGSNVTSSSLSSTLNALCTNNACSNPAIRVILTNFYAACTDELTGSSPNSDVQGLYDDLYTMLPFRAAVCAKDATSNSYCATSLSSTTPASRKRGSDSTIDPSSMTASGVLFQYMLPSSSSSQLCTACGAAVMQAYVTWEAATPYCYGLSQSPLLGSQSALWDAFNSKCGTSFLTAITADAGAAPLAAIANGASPLQKPILSALLGLAGLSAVLMI